MLAYATVPDAPHKFGNGSDVIKVPVVVGRVAGAHGVKGWLKINSFTQQPENILNYRVWGLLRGDNLRTVELTAGRMQGKHVVVSLKGLDNRDDAERMRGLDIVVDRDQLPASGQDEYYWIDLMGMHVQTVDGVDLGCVARMMETGSNDVMVVKGDRERLIPFIQSEVVTRVDFAARRITVDWDPEF